jgi:hypothetical protein
VNIDGLEARQFIRIELDKDIADQPGLVPGEADRQSRPAILQQISQDTLRVEEGSLNPALHRMTQSGWLRAESGLSKNNWPVDDLVANRPLHWYRSR